MKTFTYQSGKEVRAGDQITYHREPGEVEFVVTNETGDPARDWYFKQFPGGGFMIKVRNFGSVFLTENDNDEDLELMSHAESD
jgi:hypothetical protein